MERLDFHCEKQGSWTHFPGNLFKCQLNFFWSIKHGRKVNEKSVGSDHAGMDRAFATSARQLYHAAGRVSRAVRIQRARSEA